MGQSKPLRATVREIEDDRFLAGVEAEGELIAGDPGETPEQAVRDLLITLACRGMPIDVGLSFA